MGTRPIKISNGLWAVMAALLVLSCVGGCATHQARSVKTTGFLGDYSQLREGKGAEALLTYVNPSADFGRYSKIILEPIRVYPGAGDSTFSKMAPEDLQKLLDYFDATLRNNLGKKYRFVSNPGRDVMRIRIALSESDSSNVPLDVVSSVIPIGIAISALKRVTFGSGTSVGSASAEFEVQDSQTGQRLAAAVDRRIGSKYTFRFDKFSRWHATKAAFDHWADRLKDRLAELRKAPGA